MCKQRLHGFSNPRCATKGKVDRGDSQQPLISAIESATICSVSKHQHEIEKTMWTSLFIILFCIHRNLPFGRFFEENNPNTAPVWGFFMFICIAKIPAGTPKPPPPPSPHNHIYTHTHTKQKHTKNKQKMRAKRGRLCLYYLRRLMMKDEKQSDEAGAGDLGGFHTRPPSAR